LDRRSLKKEKVCYCKKLNDVKVKGIRRWMETNPEYSGSVNMKGTKEMCEKCNW